MKKMLFSCALLALLSSAHAATAKKQHIKSFDQFAQEYKALFGKNPDKKIWNLGHKKAPKRTPITAECSGGNCHCDNGQCA